MILCVSSLCFLIPFLSRFRMKTIRNIGTALTLAVVCSGCEARNSQLQTIAYQSSIQRSDLDTTFRDYGRFGLSKREAQAQYDAKFNAPWPFFDEATQTAYQATLPPLSAEQHADAASRKKYAQEVSQREKDNEGSSCLLSSTFWDGYGEWKKQKQARQVEGK